MRILLLIGTRKGGFVATSDASREQWTLAGPFLHCGVYRSDDGGDSWNDISNGLPSRFGFPFATLPHDGDTVFVIPEESDQARMTAGARFGIYRSRNRGDSWDRLTNGLPQSGAYLNVMRMR
jgi:hypothetical protein